MPEAHVRGARLNYVQVDSTAPGPVQDLVMVHGLATNLAFWYLGYAHVFASRFRVTLFDLRGHGHSETTSDGYRPHELAQDLEELLDALEIEKAHLMTHSFGGVVGLNFAARAPSRVRSLVLADTQLSFFRNDVIWEHADEIQSVLTRHRIPLDTRDPFFGYRLLTEMCRTIARREALPIELEQIVGPLLGKVGRRTALRWLSLVDETSALEQMTQPDGLDPKTLARLRFPILALYGSRSQAFGTLGHLRKILADGDFHTIDGAGHFFPQSRAEEVILACERFWRPTRPSIGAPAPLGETDPLVREVPVGH